MENIIRERIKNAHLTKAQRLIADYFVKNQDKVCNLSSLEVAKEIGVSDASIIRFSRAIGFDGYSDLKDHLYNMFVVNARGSISLSERLTKNSEKHGENSLTFQKLVQQNVDSVFQNNDSADFDRVAEWIVNAGARYVVGLRGCRGLSFKFGRILSFMLPNVHTITDGECSSIQNLQDICANDVMIMFVFSRFYKIDLRYLEMAREKGSKICIVTDEIASPVSPYADILLLVSSSSVSFYHSTIGSDVAAEYLLNLVGSRIDFRERLDERDRITQDQRI
jgi:DNA-binding MurR/RpiR family transcriptional regulator